MMSTCPTCGRPLPTTSSTAGLCPACLLKQVLVNDEEVERDVRSDTSEGPLVPGTTFARFEIVGLLGRGGMATVYEAREAALERIVALKVLPPEFLRRESFAARFTHEARIVARLEHPHIVPIYASGIDDDLPWMSMRLMGGSLAALLGRGLGIERTTRILRGVAEALDYAHANGVLHRDIKPSNILLDATGGGCLSDFGLARLVKQPEAWTETGTVAGTAYYMSPEQANGSTIDRMSDIYSLGVVAYEMLTGVTPFQGESPVAIGVQHLQDPLPVPSRDLVPNAVFKVLEKGLAKRSADRWPSATAFISALEAASARVGPVPARRVGSHLILVVSTVTIAAAVLAGILANRTPRGGPPTSSSVAVLTSRSLDAFWPTLPAGDAKGPLADTRPTPSSPILLPSRWLPFSLQTLPTPRTGVLPGLEADEPASEPDKPVESPNTTRDLPVTEEITPPRLKTSVRPDYPPVARRIQAQGEVVLRGTVEIDGSVTNLTVIRTPNRVLNDAAIKAASQYRYEPGRRNGAAVRSEVEIPIRFVLQ